MPIPALLSDFVSLLFPRVCLACEEPLARGEDHICTHCRAQLPYTDYHQLPPTENPLARRFWGKLPVKHTLSYLRFLRHGRVQHLLHQLKYQGQQDVGRVLGHWFGQELTEAGFATEFDLIVPVPLHPRKLAKRGYNQSFWVQWQVLQVVACLGIPTLMFSYPLVHLNSLVRGLQSKQVASLGAWIVVVSIGFGVLQQYTASPFKAWQASAFLLLSVPITLVEAYAMLGRQFRQVLLINVAYAGVFGVSHAFLVGGLLSTEQLMEWLLAGNLLRLTALAGLVWRYYQGVPPVAPVPLHTVRNLWAHTALNELIQVLFKWADKFALNFLLPAALFALYFNGTLDVPFLPLLLGAAGSALLLQLNQPDLPDTERVAMSKAAGVLLGSLVFPLFFFLLFFRYELFGVLFAHRYDAAVPLFVVSSLVIPMRAYNFTALLRHKGRGRTITTGALLDLLLAFVLVYPLYRLLGLAGVALAFVVSTYCQAGYYLVHTARPLGLSWTVMLPWRPWLGQVTGFGLAFFLLHEALEAVLAEHLVLLAGGSVLGVLLLLLLAKARQA